MLPESNPKTRAASEGLGSPLSARPSGLIRGVRVADLLAAVRAAQVVEAVVRGVAVDVIG